MRPKYLVITITGLAFIITACTTLPPQDHADTVTITDIPASSQFLIDQADQITPKPEETAGVITKEKTYTDIWKRISDNLLLTRHTQHTSVKKKLAWYARHQDYLDRTVQRARPYLYYIVEELDKRDMPLDIALLPIVESAYHPFALSPSGASGIWQFIPSTGKHYGLKQNWWYDGRRDIVASTQAALNYLQKLHNEFNGDWLLALAAYNTGERNVARAIQRNKRADKAHDFWSLRLPQETRNYVPSLLAVAELVANPQKYNITWQTITNQPYFVQMDVASQLDLGLAASLANLDIDDIYTLNPGFNRWSTDPAGPHKLLIPVANQSIFANQLSNLPEQQRISWKRHIIKRGESLSLIAKRYHTSITIVKQVNGLRGNRIYADQSLMIPRAKHPLHQYSMSLDARRIKRLSKTLNGQQYVYVIQRGDNLWDVGKRYDVSVKQLCNWNNISPNKILRPGQKLKLWLPDQYGVTSSSMLPVGLKNHTLQRINYIVKKGDSLWSIAKRFDTTVSNIKHWNNLSSHRYIQPGQTLTLHIRKPELTGT